MRSAKVSDTICQMVPMLESPVPKHVRRLFASLVIAVLLMALIHVCLGSSANLSPQDFVSGLRLGPSSDDPIARILWWNRFPRVIGCILCGFALGIVGSAFQALLRNPLADPYTVGAASGAGVGSVLAVLLPFGEFAIVARPLLATLTGFAALLFVLAVGRLDGRKDGNKLLLGGVVIGSLLHALLTFLLLLAGRDTNQVLRNLLGDTTAIFWPRLAVLSVLLVIGSLTLLRSARALNAIAMGSDLAQSFGFEVSKVEKRVLFAGTLLTAGVVGTAGILPFVGLVAAHIARRLGAIDWRVNLLTSGLVGAGVLVFADLFAQRLSEVPVGIVSALLGAPILLLLLVRESKSVST